MTICVIAQYLATCTNKVSDMREIKNTCCITGHRDIPDSMMNFVEQELRREIDLAIAEGYTRFISGFAEGADLLFAQIVADEKQKNSRLKLEAAIPYRKRMNTPNKLFQTLIKECDFVVVHSEGYHSGCFMKRNRYMVDQSQRVIAVYDGRQSGGTYATVRYAKTLAREIKTIKI